MKKFFSHLRCGRILQALTLLAVLALSPALLVRGQGTPATPPEHIVIVIEENHSYDQIMKYVGDPKNKDSYLKSLMGQGATFTSFFALHHPSQPNYIVLFSGDRQGVKGNGCEKKPFMAPSLGGELIKKRLTFRGYADGLESAGSMACTHGKYARKHVPWTNFADVTPQTELSLPFTAFQELRDFSDLPTVAMVIPNLDNDMHDGSVADADEWVKKNLAGYVEWAKTHNSLLIVTWDENNKKNFLWFNRNTKPPSNRIATIFVGPMVKSGFVSTQQYTLLDLLRTLEEMYGLPLLGASKNGTTISDIWQ